MKAEKWKKKFSPGTPFEQGIPDPKSATLPTELLQQRVFGQKSSSSYLKRTSPGLQKKLDTSKLAKFWFWPILKNESLNLVITHSIFHLHSPQFLIWEFSNHSVGYMYKLSNLKFLSLLLTIFSLWIWYLNNSCN